MSRAYELLGPNGLPSEDPEASRESGNQLFKLVGYHTNHGKKWLCSKYRYAVNGNTAHS
jgi:hypothetical protein